ncbi:phosphatidylserine decarboxylase [Allocatelliglobosispora scoriae]|uniref:Phosphatidylserine decarboxylase n=1 Tax=Allocatelliglobosispora scoriae TaxID=643052 RepID=A0A841BXR2_9ACTN|nr:phosphatidylserine decarboxylase [Allocatelliglobosispora scoriae]MBB5871562.1 phosphatidylserine decarboxylase [Allocatelliglobosispora scoriae]
MSQSVGPLGQVRIGDRAARTLTAELHRRSGPKTALLIGVSPDSLVLAEALTALREGDTLTIVGDERAPVLRAYIASLSPDVADLVTVVDSTGDAKPAEIVVVGEAVVGTADDARSIMDSVTHLVGDGGVLVIAAVAVPGIAGGAVDELDRQAALNGVGSDLVLRNTPPVRVHRLRFSDADAKLAAKLAPAYRPSSVPLAGSMNIDSNGVAAAGITLGVAALLKLIRPKSKAWLVPAIAAAPVAAFFRDPEREVPSDVASVVAASDGKVLSVERLYDERFADEEFLRIAVFLSVLDVHVNRAPIAGKVVDYFVEDGGYAAAMKPEAEHNVAAYTVLESAHGQGRVVVAQRTGLIARRIVQRAPIGSLLAKGERFGLIRFGSRTDVYLPADKAEALVAPGDRVVGAKTVIARWL